MVEYEDGAVIAQLGTPDMKLPIQYALYYPERRYLPGDRLDFGQLSRITFEKPDMETFYGLKLAIEAGKKGALFRQYSMLPMKKRWHCSLTGRSGISRYPRSSGGVWKTIRILLTRVWKRY